MQGALANLTDLFIAADYSDGYFDDPAAPGTIDETSVDNVRLESGNPVPEPSSTVLWTVGAGLFVATQRRGNTEVQQKSS